MANVSFCGLKPLLFHRKSCGFEAIKGRMKRKKSLSKGQKEGSTRESLECSSFVGGEQLMLMMQIQKKILAFRDIVDLAPCNTSSLRKMVIKTLEDMRMIYPGIVPKDEVSEIKGKSMDKVLAYFCRALKSLGESWMPNNDEMNKFNYEFPSCTDRHNVKEQGETVLAALDCLIMLASEKFDTMEEDEQNKEFTSPRSSLFGKYIMGSSGSFSDSNLSCSTSPVTPKSILLPDFMKHSASRVGGDSPRNHSTSPLLWSLRVQAVEKLNPIDLKHLPFCMSSPRMETHFDKIDKETSEDMEMDEKSSDSEDDTSRDLVFQIDTTHLLDDTRKIDYKPTNTHSLLQQPQLHKSLISTSHSLAPPPPSPLSSSHTHSSLQILQVQKSLLSPSPPPPPSSPPPPPPPLSRLSSLVSPNVVSLPPLLVPKVPNGAVQLPPPPPSPPLPLSIPQLNQSSVGIVLPLPPPLPPLLPRYSGLVAVIAPAPAPAPPVPLKDRLDSAATAPPLPPSAPLKNRSSSITTTPPLPPPTPIKTSSGSASVVPPPPPVPLKAGSILAPPPPVPCGNGVGPPPAPPLGGGKSLCPKATTKLKRSTHLGALYRKLRGKVEGPSLHSKSVGGGRKNGIGGGGSTGGKQGMADALAEMTRRSSYFQKIEEDVQKYTKQITQMGPSIANFRNKEMTELIKFHRDVESVLENLTDESQVLSRFEGFPTKKLEAIRMAVALFKKLNSILIELQNWNVVPPVGQLLDKVECYFNKIKTEIDALERTKDEESKKFKSHNIEFDFHIIVKIKEAMVDISSNCMELALKERYEMAAMRDSNSPKMGLSKMLWRAFQFAFRVYTFAGGLDDRADRLIRELATEIESDPPKL